MMQFIVLGQIPGTHFQLTFLWFQLVLTLLVAAVLATWMFYRSRQAERQLRHFARLATLQYLDLA